MLLIPHKPRAEVLGRLRPQERAEVLAAMVDANELSATVKGMRSEHVGECVKHVTAEVRDRLMRVVPPRDAARIIAGHEDAGEAVAMLCALPSEVACCFVKAGDKVGQLLADMAGDDRHALLTGGQPMAVRVGV